VELIDQQQRLVERSNDAKVGRIESLFRRMCFQSLESCDSSEPTSSMLKPIYGKLRLRSWRSS